MNFVLGGIYLIKKPGKNRRTNAKLISTELLLLSGTVCYLMLIEDG